VWYNNTQGGEFEVEIGAVIIKYSEPGRIRLVDDDGKVKYGYKFSGDILYDFVDLSVKFSF